LTQNISNDTLLNADLFKKEKNNNYNIQNIALDIDQILKNPGSYYDLVLSDKDEIIIPKVDNKISIRGGVLRPVTITYHEGITVNECISAAGGLNQYTKRNKAYVVYYNGRAKRTKQFGFFRISPKLEPGAEVILPESNEVKKDIATSLVQILSFAIQLGTSVATLKLLAQ
jgi:protein involved in polysaccharide export with SLBB domain